MSHKRSAGRARILARLVVLLALLLPLVVQACDTYDGTNLTVAKVVLGNIVYTQVVAKVGLKDIRSVGAAVANPATMDTYDLYDANTGLLTIACVTVGATTYSNVVTGVGQIVGVGGSYSLPSKPVLIPFFPMPAAVAGTAYQQQVYTDVVPHSQYTFSIDTLANGSTPPGMTINQNGILSGTAFATGATDINGNQIAHDYSFGVCATDTLSRVTTSPCPQVTVTVKPAVINLAGTWTGSWNRTNVGDGGCTYTDSGTLTLNLQQTGTSLSGTVSANGIQLRYVETCEFALNTSSQSTVTGSITDNVATLQYSLPIKETGGSNSYKWTATLSGGTTLKGTVVSTSATGSFSLSH